MVSVILPSTQFFACRIAWKNASPLTPAEIREYTHKFDMVAAPVHFAYTEIEKCPRKLSIALSRERAKYCVVRSEEDEKRKSFLLSLSCGINSGRRRQ